MTHKLIPLKYSLRKTRTLFFLAASALSAALSIASPAQSPSAAFYGAPITTITGNGTAGSSGNGAAAASALVSAPRGGVFDSAGNFYFADSGNNVVRKILKSTGAISVVQIFGLSISGGLDNPPPAATITLKSPSSVAIDSAGNLYIADTGNDRILFVNASNSVGTTIAGTYTISGYTGDNGLATSATFNQPTGVAIDGSGNIYVTDAGNNALRAFTNGGNIVTVAGNGTVGDIGDGGAPQLAELNAPTAVKLDLSGNIYIADTGNAVIRRIVPTGSSIYTFQGTINTYAGVYGSISNTGDGGLATNAGLQAPSDIGFDAAGDLYIAASGEVRMVSSASGIIHTVAGTGATGTYSGENGSALTAIIPSPAQGLFVDPVGDIYLSDTAGNRILKIAGSIPATVAFGNQSAGTTSAPLTVTLYNSGNVPLSITNISAPTGTVFTLSSTAANACTNTTTLAASTSCTFTVTFAPTAEQNYSSQIVVTDNSLNNTSSMQTILLAGNGLYTTKTVVAYSPSNPAYGQIVTLTATVSEGANPTGSVTFVVNSTTATEPLVNGVATYSLNTLPAGSNLVAANYLGDSVNAPSSGTATVAVSQGVLTVTANSFSIYSTQALPAFTYVVSGPNIVTGGVNTPVSLAYTGTPALSTTATPSSPLGTYPITVGLGTLASTNYTFVFVPGTLTILKPFFVINVSPKSLTLASGQGGVITATITPTIGYVGTVNLACGPLPANVLCTFNASSVDVDASGAVPMELTVSTDNHPAVGSNSPAPKLPWNHDEPLFLAIGLPFLSLGLLSRRRIRKLRILPLISAAVLLIWLQSLTGCTQAYRDAAPFTGTITVTGTDATNATAQDTFSLTIH